MFFTFDGAYALPGITTLVETYANQFWFDRPEHAVWTPIVLSGASRDTGNSPTSILRPGLLLGRVTSTKKLKQWDPTATDGTQYIVGVLNIDVQTQKLGSDADRFLGHVMVKGNVMAGNLLIPGQASLGIASNAYEHLIRAQMSDRFTFDDKDFRGNVHGGWRHVQAKTADYTVLETDNDVIFTNRGAGGAVNFTLPATAKLGLRYRFFVVADQTVTITAGTADTMIVYNDAAADSIALSTASNKIGGGFEVIGDGTGWMVFFYPGQTSDGTATGQRVTVAT